MPNSCDSLMDDTRESIMGYLSSTNQQRASNTGCRISSTFQLSRLSSKNMASRRSRSQCQYSPLKNSCKNTGCRPHILQASVKRLQTMRPQASVRRSHISHAIGWPCSFLGFTFIILLHTLTLTKANVFSGSSTASSITLNHLILDAETGQLYVGAVDHLFRLNADLSVLEEVETGPRMDNQACLLPPDSNSPTCHDFYSTSLQKVSTHNTNKILLLHGANLTVCGSIYQGACQMVPKTNIGKLSSLPLSDILTPVAASTDSASTVAFIGPGPPDPLHVKVMYVAATSVGPTGIAVNYLFPAVSSRNIEGAESEFFEYAYEDKISYQGGTYLVPENREYYVNYIDGFSVDGYSYFLTTQPTWNDENVVQTTYVSKIIQICQSDEYYNSYGEIVLLCGDYNLIQDATITSASSTLATALGISANADVLIATFTKGTSTSESAVCIYTLDNIRQRFTSNIEQCYQGNGGLAFYLTEQASCTAQSFVNVEQDFCGQTVNPTLNRAMAGSQALSSTPIMTTVSGSYAAVLTENINEYTVLYLTTSQGFLKKALLYPNQQYVGFLEYSQEQIEAGATMHKDMQLDLSQNNIYIPTTTKVYKKTLADCAQFTTCTLCLEAQDPHCGWCSLEKRCSRKSECSNANWELRWLTFPDQQCVAITSVSPMAMDIHGLTTVDVAVDRMPTQYNQGYKCVFGDTEYTASIKGDGSGILCDTPQLSLIPAIPQGEDHITIIFGIKSLESTMVFLETDFTFYSCAVQEGCTLCTSSAYYCQWCTYNNECAYSTAACPTQASIISSVDMCPSILLSQTVLIPNGVSRSIPLQARNLPEPLAGMSDYECLVHLETPPVRVQATRAGSSSVTCSEHAYTYSSPETEKTVSVDVVWNSDFYVDETEATEVTVYKCDLMADDCSQCTSLLTTAPEYGCIWCETSCSFEDTCTSPAADACPLPNLIQVDPLTGPLEGGTRVTISGSNLGSSFSAIQDGVLVAGQPCTPIEGEYVAAKRIVCTTSEVNMETRGVIQLTVGDQTVYGPTFSYQNPTLTGVYPSLGPMSGGTEITIEGNLLNTGSSIIAYLDNNLVCNNAEVQTSGATSKLTCTTSAVQTQRTTSYVTVLFDAATRTMTHMYSYVDDPTITGISPTTVFASGGRVVSVTGTAFLSIQRPMMFIEQGTWKSNNSLCTVQSDTHIECPSPTVINNLITNQRRRREVADDSPRYGFVMDGVAAVQNLPDNFPSIPATVSVVSNPVYYPFDLGMLQYRGDFLVLEGDNLTLACTKHEVKVKIGNEVCIVAELSETKLLCTPPDEQPPGVNADGMETTSQLPKVKVTFGFNTTVLGALEYQTENPMLTLPVIVAIGIGGGVFLIIIISVLIVYHRKSKEAERQIKKMLVQLDALESNVRNECKQAFAELQTEVTDLTSDLTNQGIPFWDYHTYTFKVLFPTHSDHPILHESLDNRLNPNQTYLHDTLEYQETKLGSWEQGLQQFNQLLNSKQFLIMFIRTLEGQKNFSMRDKAVVASLLMVVLQDKMEYATEILKALLNELIDRSVEKRNPKLLFRRTESVVEKFLTNWLSLCMYDYLKKHAGQPLYLLYKAIKLQTEKGPVDAITAEARYSLSEDRLLREKIEPKILTCQLVLENSQETHTCKMMDCDTITQAKEKALDAIYMNTPFSRRPSVYDIDLEWRSGRSGHLPLQDEDVTTEMVKGWKKINTLAHYHIPEGATLAVVPKRNKNDYIRNVHGMVEITSGSSLSRLTPIITVEEGHKVWHLVKHDDNQYQSRTQKVISEIFLTRLLTTKGTMQQYIDDLFLTILKVDNTLPTAVKYLFDFLDQAARRHNILDPEVLHTWKSNSLPLRFWVNIIKNPEFVFDIHKSHIVDSSLSVIAQTFMDSCSASSHILGKDSPTNKLLFAKDIPKYRKWVERYYKEVSEASAVSDRDMNVAMTELSMHYIVDFNITSALKELFRYANHYNYELLEALDNDPSAKKLHLAHKFDQINSVMESGSLY